MRARRRFFSRSRRRIAPRVVRLPGGLDARAARDVHPLRPEDVLQSGQHSQGRPQLRVVAHQADPPDAAAQGAERCGDLHTELVQQLRPDGFVLHPGRDARRGDHGEAVFGVAEQFEPHRRESGLERRPGAMVAPEPGVGAFLGHQPQGFPQRVGHARRQRVVIQPLRAPVALQLAQVEVVGGHGGAASGDRPLHPVVVRNRRHAGRASQALLRAGGAEVDPPVVDAHRHAAQRHDGIDDQKRVMRAADPSDVLERLQHPGRGLAVDDRHDLGGFALEGVADGAGVDDAPPLGRHLSDARAVPSGEVDEEIPEPAAVGDEDAVAGFDQRGDRRFHAGASGPRDGEGPGVGSLKRFPAQGRDLLHDRGEGGVELAQHGSGEGAQDPGIRVGGPGAAEQPGRRIEIADEPGHRSRLSCGIFRRGAGAPSGRDPRHAWDVRARHGRFLQYAVDPQTAGSQSPGAEASPGREAMRALALVVAAAVIVGILWDAFETIVLPRRVSRRLRLARLTLVPTWGLISSVFRRWPPGGRRENLLGYYGPLAVILLLASWAAGLILGFALLLWGLGSPLAGPDGRPVLGTDIYLSGTTFFTLGLGDVTPRSWGARAITVAEAGIGFSFLALVIS